MLAASAVLLFISHIAAQDNGRFPIPPPDLREADVTFSKRTWRIIDLQEKQNLKAVWPGAPVNRILFNAALAGQLKPYLSDSLTKYFNPEELVKMTSDTEYVETPVDPDDPTVTVQKMFVTPFDPEQRIKWLLLMEDWYFSRKYSRMIPRIVAIAPLYKRKALGIELGLQPLCWFRYDDRLQKEADVRDILVKHRIFNPRNQSSQLTFDDWFEQRLFGSYIIKSSNMYDISISAMPEFKKNGLEALMEAERQKQHLNDSEQERWEE